MGSWLLKNLPTPSYVGVQPNLFSKDDWDNLSRELEANGKTLVPVQPNLIDLIWNNKPLRSLNPVIRLGMEFSGKSISNKLKDVRGKVEDEGAEILVVTELDEIACTFLLLLILLKYNFNFIDGS